MLQGAYNEDQGLAEVDLSDVMDPFDSNQFVLYPRAVSFFQRLCPDPFPPASKSLPTAESVMTNAEA